MGAVATGCGAIEHVKVSAPLEEFEFDGAKFTISHDEEVSASAGGVEEPEFGQIVVQLGELPLIGLFRFESAWTGVQLIR